MSKHLKTLVIGTSLSQLSDGVVRTGAAIARATGASVWLVHAYIPPPYGAELTGGSWSDLQNEILRSGLERQAQRTGLADLSGFRPEQLRAQMGSAPRELIAIAHAVHADLIVLGAEESGALQRAFLGSTADGVIRKAPCPVLVVRSEPAFPPARVEIPVDFSPVSAAALHKGLRFLTEIGAAPAETEVLFVLDPFETGGSLHFTPEQIERFAGEELRHFITRHSPGQPPRLARIRNGYPRDEIVAVLADRRTDLAILGTHGRTGLERLAIGSVAAEVMHRAACNLLLIPPDSGVVKEDLLREQPLAGEDWTYVSDPDPVAAGRP